ncbi:hypothetical protein J6590_092443, partial [Homalodisca vitripennis]
GPHGIKQITVGPPHGIKQITMFIRENVDRQLQETHRYNSISKFLPTVQTYYSRSSGSCSKYRFERVLGSQKKAGKTLSKLTGFRELGLLTLPCHYIFEVVYRLGQGCPPIWN